MINARTVSSLFAIASTASGLIAFVPIPLVAPDGVFAVKMWHKLVHIVIGLVLGAGAYLGERAALGVAREVSVFYIIVTVPGLLTPGQMLLDFIHVNQADKWLHSSLATVITFAGFILFRGRSRLAEAG
ncbi:MAG: DUF4383 domain-containing protein [Acidobacteriota bacterium]|nr:MAG: DUF4383 domain-containing protein [Acidobacteriota bacterium]